MVKFKVVRTFDEKRERWPHWEIIHVKSRKSVYSSLGDEHHNIQMVLRLADQYERRPSLAKHILEVNMPESKYA